MKNTYRDNKFGDRKPGNKKFIGGGRPRKPGFGGPGGFAGELHEATCASCGKPCRVPFKPNGSKPVLCGNCFKREGGAAAGPTRFERPSYGAKRTYSRDSAPSATQGPSQIEMRLEAMEMKMDRILREIEAIKEQNG